MREGLPPQRQPHRFSCPPMNPNHALRVVFCPLTPRYMWNHHPLYLGICFGCCWPSKTVSVLIYVTPPSLKNRRQCNRAKQYKREKTTFSFRSWDFFILVIRSRRENRLKWMAETPPYDHVCAECIGRWSDIAPQLSTIGPQHRILTPRRKRIPQDVQRRVDMTPTTAKGGTEQVPPGGPAWRQ